MLDGLNHKLFLEVFEEKYHQCYRCELAKTRNNLVWGDGDAYSASTLILGEAPGEDEDEQGVPFIGKSGSLLREYLNKAAWEKKEYFITNTVLCRPPNNRKPTMIESLACSSRLATVIECMDNLKLIICVGAVSMFSILGTKIMSGNMGLNKIPSPYAQT